MLFESLKWLFGVSLVMAVLAWAGVRLFPCHILSIVATWLSAVAVAFLVLLFAVAPKVANPVVNIQKSIITSTVSHAWVEHSLPARRWRDPALTGAAYGA